MAAACVQQRLAVLFCSSTTASSDGGTFEAEAIGRRRRRCQRRPRQRLVARPTNLRANCGTKMGKAGNPNWLPGVSGNPGGRSRELAQQQGAARLEAASHASEGIAYLLQVLRSEEEGTAHRSKSGIELFTRGLEVPQAQIDIDVIVRRKISEMSLDELRQLEERLVGSFTSTTPLLLEGQLDPIKQPEGSDG